MNILLPVDKYPASGNSIIDETSAAIQKFDSSIHVTQDISRFWEAPYTGFDCVHIHWPEALIGWRIPTETDLNNLETTVEKWREHAKLVVTVHNLSSHNSNPMNQKLYDLIYSSARVLIHMSKISQTLLRDLYSGLIPEETCHKTIPHGLYGIYDNKVSREDARKKLNLNPDDFVILIFGQIRTDAEKKIVKGLIERLPDKKKKIVVPQWSFTEKKWQFFLKKKIVDKPNYRFMDIFIPDNEVQYYLNSADILFIQRLHNLNSGSLLLGFAFGKVVVGPDYGSVGEILKETGNPTFSPSDFQSIIKAVQKGKTLLQQNKGFDNLKYANENWNMELTAQRHIQVYKDNIETDN